jgi:glycosyltransferase involved in cell wall biosynthesis
MRMHLGIDATNIRQGGGITHLIQILSAANPTDQGYSKITVWCCESIAQILPRKPWLFIRTNKLINGHAVGRFLFQHLALSLQMRFFGCSMAFSPGGSLPLISLLPTVTMSQNMLPFEPKKAKLFGLFSKMYVKLFVLRLMMTVSYRRAVGIIFLTAYAQNVIKQYVRLPFSQALIPHGIEARFIGAAKLQKPIEDYSLENPFRLVYTSILMPYKHQIELIKAIKTLRNKGIPIFCQLIGPAWDWYGDAVKLEIKALDPKGNFIQYLGEVSFGQLHEFYRDCDAFVFSSSCENLPNILIEAMASGLPIVCSNAGPMPEILGSSSFFFDPASLPSIESSIESFLRDVKKRSAESQISYTKGKSYSWEKCAEETFRFIKACQPT